MTIEAQLAEHTEILKAILTTLQSGAAIPTPVAASVAETTEKKTTGRKGAGAKESKATDEKTDPAAADPLGLVEGDASGTRYWISDSLSTVYTQKPGDPDPEDQSFKIESAAHYSAKKDEFAKKSAAAAEAQKGASSEPSATAAQGTASGASFKDVTEALMAQNQKLAKTDPDAGRAFVIDVLTHFLPKVEKKTVPQLEALGKHDEIMAYINAKIEGTGADSDSDLF